MTFGPASNGAVNYGYYNGSLQAQSGQTDRETETRNKEETDNVTARVLKEVQFAIRTSYARHKMGWSREREGREWFHWTRVQVPRMSHANPYSTTGSRSSIYCPRVQLYFPWSFANSFVVAHIIKNVVYSPGIYNLLCQINNEAEQQ